MNVISAVMLAFFSVLGIAALIRELALFIFRYKSASTVMLIVPMKNNCKDAELLLRSAVSRVKWMSRGKNDCVICLDCGMDSEARKICENICEENGFTRMISKSELIDSLK